MKMADVGLLDECFTHVDDVTGVQTTYAATALFAFCEAHPDQVEKIVIDVEESHAQYCVTNRGVEQDRLAVLLQNPEYLKKPILFVQTPDDTHLLIDGTHRYVVYFALKMPTISAYMVPWNVAKDFIVEDLPQTDEATLMAHSGLTVLRKLTQ